MGGAQSDIPPDYGEERTAASITRQSSVGQMRNEESYIMDAEVAKRAAEKGDKEAQFTLGTYYAAGRGVKMDMKKALKCYALSAEQGHAYAMTRLGDLYEAGRGGVEQSYEKALYWYRKAEEAGFLGAMMRIAYFYMNGKGVLPSATQAVKYFQMAADKGSEMGIKHGISRLAFCYLKGYGVKQDLSKAEELFLLSGDSYGVRQSDVPMDQLLVGPIPEKFICIICCNLFKDPVQCPNGHVYCRACLTQCAKDKQICPLRCKVDVHNLSKNLYVQSDIQGLQCHCRYHFKWDRDYKVWQVDPNGCNSIVTLETRWKHEYQCPHATLWCQYCATDHTRASLSEHEEKCKMRPISCPNCSTLVTAKDMEHHARVECSCQSVECEQCHQQYTRGSKQLHFTNECPETEIACDYAPFGCTAKVRRKNTTEHLRHAAIEHSAISVQTFMKQKRKIEALEKELEEYRPHKQKMIPQQFTNDIEEFRRPEKSRKVH